MQDFHSDVHKSHLAEGLSHLWQSGRFCDTVISVEGKTFPCHRVILSAVSPYFNAMYTSGMRESLDGLVTIHNIQASVFQSILNFIYCGNIVITAENTMDMLHAASLFQISTLQQVCEKNFCENLSPQTCIAIWRISQAYSCTRLTEHAWNYIIDNFKSVCRSEDFLELTKEELFQIINEDNLNVENEETVCDAVLPWLEHDRKRLADINEIFHNLRLPLMNSNYISTLLETKPCIRDNPDCCDHLLQMQRGGHRQELTPAQYQMFRERNEQVLVMVDGRRQEVACFSLQRKKSFALAKFPYFADGKASCVLKGDIYVCGGTSGVAENRLVKYETKRNRWVECAPLQQGRCYHELVSVGDNLYAVGGFVVNAAVSGVEEYNIHANRWTKVGDLLLPVGGLSASSLKDTIYMFGGKKDRLDRKTAVFQSFDTRTRTSAVLGNLPVNTCWSQALTIDDAIYVVSPDGNVIKYTQKSYPAIVSVIKNLDCEYFRIVNHNRKILILQVGDTKYYDELRIFDPTSSDVIVARERLPRSLCDSDWLKVVINRHHLKYECSSHHGYR
ncbi:kelch-like protein 24 [Haliotis rufescens]|uniref:kelch-like protein 24 n=1 Tax=Haliotis rufescens TaxID=6454 RepID=UPI001EB0807F|nr:kelch-like protein 24 [Haliotis rufescens]XP_046354969.1 kelch-like protein 24 [Haliotis rufescens]XP_046354970.1 kelch-like protein 24 [Haliotis rufescens]